MGRSSGKYPSRTKFNKKKKISKSRKLYWCQRKQADQELAKSKVLHDHMYTCSESSDKHNYVAEQQTPCILSVNIEKIENLEDEIVHTKIIEEDMIEEPVFDEFSFISQEECDWSAQPSKPTENSLQYSCPSVNEDRNSLPTTTGPKPKFIIIVRKCKRQQRCKLPEASSSVQNGNALEEFSETKDIQDYTSDQTSYTPEVEANDEKVENTPFEFVDCAYQIPPEQDGKDLISSEQDMLEEEFETKTLTCIKIKNEESASISWKQISESQEVVKVPYAINHELFIKDEIIEEEYETE